MALIGNCITVSRTDTGEKEQQEVQLPDGTMEIIDVPVLEEVTKEHTNCYVVVKQIEMINFWCSDCGKEFDSEGNITKENFAAKNSAIHFHVGVYKDKETRDADQEDFVHWEALNLNDVDLNKNIYSQCYDQIKTYEGYKNLIND